MWRRLKSWGPTGHPACHDRDTSAAVTGDTVPAKTGIVVVVGLGVVVGTAVVVVVGWAAELAAPSDPGRCESPEGGVDGPGAVVALHDARAPITDRRATGTMVDRDRRRRRGRSTDNDATETYRPWPFRQI
jgi:hypothetical protein